MPVTTFAERDQGASAQTSPDKKKQIGSEYGPLGIQELPQSDEIFQRFPQLLLINRFILADAALKEADKTIEAAKQTTAKIEEAKTKIIETNKNQKAEESTWKVLADLTKYLKASIDTVAMRTLLTTLERHKSLSGPALLAVAEKAGK